MSKTTGTPDWFAVVRKARYTFIRDNYYEPTELHLPHAIRRALAVDERTRYMWGQALDTFIGMRVIVVEGPLALIARRPRGHTIRWRLGLGQDEAIVTEDERAATWAPR